MVSFSGVQLNYFFRLNVGKMYIMSKFDDEFAIIVNATKKWFWLLTGFKDGEIYH